MEPFVRLLIPAGLGILFSLWTGLPWQYGAACCAVTWLSSWFFISRREREIPLTVYTWLSVFFFFTAMSSFMAPGTDGLPDGEYLHAEIVLDDELALNGRWGQTRGTIVAYRSDGTDWKPDSFGVQLYINSAYTAAAGERLLVKGYFNAFVPDSGSYESLMVRRGIAGRMYVKPGSLLAAGETRPGRMASIHNSAVRKMSSMPGDKDRISVVSAMVSGDKRQIPREIRAVYRDGGGAHLLAVSGLHVGIVFMLVNIFLYFIPVMRRGHIVKNLLAVTAVWLFAVAAGSSPSVVRAALMFSFAQFALAAGTRRGALNVIAASAFVMLAVNPNYAADPSFVLSYSAVLAIILFFGPVYGLLRTGSKFIDGLISVYIVGIVASLAVAPFVSYWFGAVPLSGIIVNPLVILTAHIIVAVGAVWLIWPFGFGGAAFGWIAGKAVTVQDYLMGWCASLDRSGVDGRIPLWAAIMFYCALISFSIPISRYVEYRKRRLNLPEV